MTKPRGPRGLSREAILLAAVTLLEDCGEEAFSLRKVGQAAGCDAMSVSYHFGSKEGLNRALAAWLDNQVDPGPKDAHWRLRLRHIADQYRKIALKYPCTFPFLLRYTHTGLADYTVAEIVHLALKDARVADRRLAITAMGWYAAVIGLAMSEVSGLNAPISDAVAQEISGLSPREFPVVRSLLDDYRDVDPGVVFTSTLEMLLDGIEHSAKESAPRHGPPPISTL